jgi:hypothetical protein
LTDALFEATQLQGSDEQMTSIAQLMVDEDSLARSLETQEALAEDLRRRLHELRTKALPEAMLAAGVDRFRCAETGTEARIAFECSGALGEDPAERDRKLDLLIANGADEIVKTEVTATFNKDEFQKAMALLGELQRRGLPTIIKRNIHPMTLKAWVKERMEEGADLPLDDIGLWYGQIAKIKRPKADG